MSVALASSRDAPATVANPFLKWAGGKRQLLPQIRRFYPERFTRYSEPFLGSGAVFFDLASRGRLAGKPVLLMDRNPDLIACYLAVRDQVEDVIRELRVLEAGHRAEGSAFYYDVRDRRFNPSRRLLAHDVIGVDRAAELAAMMIYLNRTCFNGLFRLNARGDFNTPAGRYVNPTVCDATNLRNVSAVLSAPGVTLRVGDFEGVTGFARKGTFAYFDPPYVPVSRTANFTAYTAVGFSDERQTRLRDVVGGLARRGVRVLVSNSVAPLTTRLYETSEEAQRAGLRTHRVAARRAINCDGSSRGTVNEYLVANFAPLADDGR